MSRESTGSGAGPSAGRGVETPPPQGCVDVWWLRPEAVEPSSCDGLLSPDERAYAARFVQHRDRHRHAVGWALVRRALSRYEPRDPADWSFGRGENGKPHVAAAPARLHFNLSHTAGLVVCAVSGAPVGVDAERMNGRVETLALAGQFFAPDEAASLAALAPGRRIARFFRYWTLKEAYLKARGLGLSVPLRDISFAALAGGGGGVRFSPGFADDAGAWRFATLRCGRRVLISAAQRTDAAVLDVRMRDGMELLV